MSVLSCGNAAAFGAMRLRFLDADTTGSNDALLRGSVSNFASPRPLAVGFVWSTTNPAPTLATADGATPAQYVLSTSGFVTTTFSARTDALAPGTYFVRVYARGCGGAGCMYSPPGTAFAVPVFSEVAMVSVTQTTPTLVTFTADFQGSTYVFEELGFLWSGSVFGLYNGQYAGTAGGIPSVVGNFAFALNTSVTPPPGTYYVTAYARSTLMSTTLLAENYMEFTVGA
jgi:hypothetical protein